VYIPLTALEGDDPLYTITANKRLPDGSKVPMDLTGGGVTWLVKLAPDTDDVDAIATYPATITDAEAGTFTGSTPPSVVSGLAVSRSAESAT
jgi:hypothetical protein